MVKVENQMNYGFDDPPFVELCDCDESHVRCLAENFEHVKREYYWIIREFVCLKCEMVWIKRTYVVGKGDNWEIIQEPTGDDDE